MLVRGFRVFLPKGWYSLVKDKMSYKEFLKACKITGVGKSRIEKDKDNTEKKEYYSISDIITFSYNDETGLTEFHFKEPKVITQIHPLLLPNKAKQSVLELVWCWQS